MRLARRALFALAVLALTGPAHAQVFPNIPPSTLLGRLGAGQSGPPQAIPLANISNFLTWNVGATHVNNGNSTSTQFGILFNKNGVLGDSSSDSGLSNGLTGGEIVISSNAAAIPNVATIVGGGGITAPLVLATADGGETIFNMASFGTNSNATIVLTKARGTAAAPQPLLSGDIIGLISANGWSTAGVNGGAPGTGRIQFVASENWSSTHNGTAIQFISQINATAYPTNNVILGAVNGDGGWTFGEPATPLQSFGPGTAMFSSALYVNPNAAQINSGLTGTTFHSSQADSTANITMMDAFASNNGLIFRRGDGTGATPTALQNNDLIGSVGGLGMGATTFATTSRANINFNAAQNWTDTAQGTYIDLVTTANGGTTHTANLRVENDGGITIPPTVTGGDKGAGTVNAGALYVSGTAVLTTNQTITLSGDVTGSGATSIATTVGNITSGATMPGFYDFTQTAAPSNPASGHDRIFMSTADTLKVLNSAGNITTTVVPISGVSHQWISALNNSGVFTQSQPGFGDLSGNISTSQMNSGTSASSGTYWRGDGTWVQPSTGALSDVANAGSWTPSDQSGASLTFTNVSVGYTRIGNMIFIYGRLTFPSTASGASVLIGGLPVTAANQNYASAPGVCNSNGTIGIQAQPSKNATTFFLLNSITGANLTNANMSTQVMNCTFAYPAT